MSNITRTNNTKLSITREGLCFCSESTFVNIYDVAWLSLHLKFGSVHILQLDGISGYHVECRPTRNLIACAYRLKCSPSAHIIFYTQ